MSTSQEQSVQESKQEQPQESEEEIHAIIERWKSVTDELELESVKQQNRVARFMREARTLKNPHGNNLRLVFSEIHQTAESIQILSYFAWHLLDFLSGQRVVNKEIREEMPEKVGASFAKALAKIEAMRKAANDDTGDSEGGPSERLFPKKDSEHVQLS